ncbi:acyl-CoA dehydrogenase [Mycobacterium alsense]|uniref:Acyl-CoA dehydrogenase n=1 Tax=Mycobacterium alsense TaxID=324058 RepID=A0AA42C1T3_9MYCO|nr:acyl-CoA dehydrogenase [Mycobacterium alsense]MCV7380964.1 acyl-CoA dehydrogenase [Mycobacterium alsense]OQZ91373.1 acyl-CoA dehydrogenase [Mycobacterium alsense]
MVCYGRPVHGITAEFVARLAERAEEAERLRRLPAPTVGEFRRTELFRLLLPARFGGIQAPFPELLQPIRRMAHGCPSSAWTLGFYALHNWMLSLFDPKAQEEVFAAGPVLAPAPLAPTGRAAPTEGGVRLSGRWAWATGAMDADWMIVGALIERPDRIDPALAVLPAEQAEVVDTWHTAGMRGTGSHDVVVTDVLVPEHRIVAVADIYGGTAPGARFHDAPTYRWPLVPALALTASMPVLGAAERVTDLFAERLGERVLAYSGVAQKDQPAAQIRLADARVRLRALRALIADTADGIERLVAGGERVGRPVRADARLAAAHTVHESRAIIADLLEASGASAQFLSSPLQRFKRDVDIASGHVVFDYDMGRELAGALAIGAKISPIAMV